MEVEAAPTTCHHAKFLGVTPRTKEVTSILVIWIILEVGFFLYKKKPGSEGIAHTPLISLVSLYSNVTVVYTGIGWF